MTMSRVFYENILDRKANFESIIEFCKYKFGNDLNIFEPELSLRMENINKRIEDEYIPTEDELRATRQNYDYKLGNMRRQEKINVIFLMWKGFGTQSNSFWNGASLYENLMKDRRFSVTILLVLPDNTNFNDDIDFLFFKQRDYNVSVINSETDLRAFNPDIVFYGYPWHALGLKNRFSPFNVSEFALCLHYAYAMTYPIEIPNFFTAVCQFFMLLYKHFVFNSCCVRQFEMRGIYNTVATGNPKLDIYAKKINGNPWRDTEKIKIIYAPHHSFTGNLLSWATFEWNGKQILQLAKNNPHTEWIFKPHPLFKKNIIDYKIMTEQELEAYYDEWSQIGQVYEKGDYFDIFRTSDFLITDCGSFIDEYLPTTNPVIQLDSGAPRSTVSEKHSRHYYKVRNLKDLYSTFDMLVNRRKDPLKEKRMKDAAEITFNSADNIYNEILNILKWK
jgi:hypothetical protein